MRHEDGLELPPGFRYVVEMCGQLNLVKECREMSFEYVLNNELRYVLDEIYPRVPIRSWT